MHYKVTDVQLNFFPINQDPNKKVVKNIKYPCILFKNRMSLRSKLGSVGGR